MPASIASDKVASFRRRLSPTTEWPAAQSRTSQFRRTQTMKCSEGMLKRPVYAALLWLIVATFVVTALHLKGWYNYYQEREAANVAKQLSTPEGTARINKIATAALAKGELTGEQYAKTVLDIRDIEMRMDHAVGINDSVPQLAAITKIPGSVMGGLSAYLTREQEQRYGSLGMDWAAIGSLLVIGCMFIPLAFLILAMRLAMMARTPRQLLVMFRAEWLELVGASLCWGVGLGVYKPHESCSLMDKIRQLGYREDEDTSIDWEAKRTHALALISRGRFDAVSPLQAESECGWASHRKPVPDVQGRCKRRDLRLFVSSPRLRVGSGRDQAEVAKRQSDARTVRRLLGHGQVDQLRCQRIRGDQAW